MTEPSVAAIVLAAGQGTRFAAEADGAYKLLATWRGRPLVSHVVAAALGSSASPVILVTGHRRLDVLAAAAAGERLVERHNSDHASGLASSLRAGLGAVPPDAPGALVLLADMPRVTPALLDSLIAAFRAHPGCEAVVPTFGGRRGNPVLLGCALFPALGALTGDEGARRVLATGTNVVEVAADAAVTLDVDDPRTLRVLEAS